MRWPSSVVAKVACAALTAVAAAPVLAADPTDITIDRMRLASERAGVLSVESGRVLPHREMAGAAWLGYANDPLVLHKLGDPSRRVASVLADRSGGIFAAAIGVLDRGQLALEIPVVFQQARHSGAVTPGSVDAFGVGSIRLVPKVRLLDEGAHGVDLAVLAGVDVPLGATDFVGSELALRPEVAASRRLGALRLAANVGAVVRDEATWHDTTMGNELSAQLGAAYDLKPRFSLPLEAGLVLASAVSASSPFQRSDETSVELRGYGAFDVGPTLRLLAGGGAGLESGWGTPDWRVFAGAQFGFQRPAARVVPSVIAAPAAVAPPPPPAPVAPPDVDGDGFADASDRCPTLAGLAENGGCPDRDRDGDGVVDRKDECPDLPGEAEHGGCHKLVAVKFEVDRFTFKDTIHFATGSDVIKASSAPLLDGIATVIQAHPEIARIRVEGHTDSVGGRAYNKGLSDRRARSVVRALVGRGVAAERLEAAGVGLDRPIADNRSRAGRALNRRVELRVADPRTTGIH
jgi:outer membrane protein OmpA-like peptidoglycan-associated protein